MKTLDKRYRRIYETAVEEAATSSIRHSRSPNSPATRAPAASIAAVTRATSCASKPLNIAIPLGFRTRIHSGARSEIQAGLMLAAMRSAELSAKDSVDPRKTPIATPARSKFSSATRTASGSLSLAHTWPAPSLAAASARIPDPVPTSTTVVPGFKCLSIA